jgi:hypothetical protein
MFRAHSAHHQDVNDAKCTYAASGIVGIVLSGYMPSYLIRSRAYSYKFLVRLTQQMCNIRCVLSIKWGFYWTDADKNKIHVMQNFGARAGAVG